MTVVTGVIDSGNYYESVVTPDNDTYTDNMTVVTGVIDSGNYWKSIIEG
jgi:hypothetical protein